MNKTIDQPMAKYINPPSVKAYQLQDDGSIPNNTKLPLLIYDQSIKLDHRDPAAVIEDLLETNSWGGSWRNSIYPYHHYHSTAHEVLVVFSGRAQVQLGGEGGITETLNAGDVVIIPAGVGHKNLGASQDFAVVGAYPARQHWDMCHGKPGERPKADKNIARVPLPEADPVYGPNGPLVDKWQIKRA